MTIKLWSLTGNSQKLDGGAMFGNVPRAIWSKWVEVDEENRIDLACRALLAAWTDMLANAGGTEGAEMAPWRAQAADLQAVTTIAARNAEDAMHTYQAAIGQFPASVLAQVGGFGPR